MRAALAMLASLPAVERPLAGGAGEPIPGSASASTPARPRSATPARSHKFKYGPLGNTVNLASRVQGLTKYLQRPLLIDAGHARELGDDFIARRVGPGARRQHRGAGGSV